MIVMNFVLCAYICILNGYSIMFLNITLYTFSHRDLEISVFNKKIFVPWSRFLG